MERYDLSVHRGETFQQQVIFKDAAGDPEDLTGCAAYSQVRPEPDSEELICSMDCRIDGEHGAVTMIISADVTKTIPVGCYAYDFMMVDPSDAVTMYFGGKFAVLPSVTEIS